MKSAHFPARAVALFAAVFATFAGAEEIGPDGLGSLPEVEVVFLGEVHDNPLHHAHQAAAVAALGANVLIFEMLTEEQAARLRPEHYGSAEEMAAVLGWDGSGWPDFAMYHPIFLAAPDAQVLGGGLDRDIVRRAVTEGAAATIPDWAEVFALGAPLPDAEQAARESGQAEAHCGALPPEMLPGMVEAQRLRDAALARAVLTAVVAIGGPVVVITGNGHARRDWGAPAMLARLLPDMPMLTIGQFELEASEDPPFDLWLVTEAADRPDPCLALRDR